MALQKKTTYEHTLGGRAENAAEKVRLTFRKVGGGGLIMGGAAGATALLLAGTLVFSPATIERASNGIQDRFRQIIQSDGAKDKVAEPVAAGSEEPLEVAANDVAPVEADAVQDFVLSSGTAPLDKGVPGAATSGNFAGSVELDEDGATAGGDSDGTDGRGTDDGDDVDSDEDDLDGDDSDDGSDGGDTDVDEDTDIDDGDTEDSDGSGKGNGKVKEEKPAKPADSDSDDDDSDEGESDDDAYESDDDAEDAVVDDRKKKTEDIKSEDGKEKEGKGPKDFESDLAL